MSREIRIKPSGPKCPKCGAPHMMKARCKNEKGTLNMALWLCMTCKHTIPRKEPGPGPIVVEVESEDNAK